MKPQKPGPKPQPPTTAHQEPMASFPCLPCGGTGRQGLSPPEPCAVCQGWGGYLVPLAKLPVRDAPFGSASPKLD